MYKSIPPRGHSRRLSRNSAVAGRRTDPWPVPGQISGAAAKSTRWLVGAFDWLTKYSAAATVAIGLVLYVSLRLPYSAYYGALRTSPEEIGLSYIELLAQSTLAVVLLATGGTVLIIFIAGIMSYFYLAYRFVRIVMAGFLSAVPKERRDGDWLEQDYVAVERATMQYVRRRMPSMEQFWIDAHTKDWRSRKLASLPTRTPKQQAEYEALSKEDLSPSEKKKLKHLIVREILRVAKRMAPIIFVCAVFQSFFC